MNYLLIGLYAFLLMGFGVAADVPFVFSGDHASIANYTSEQISSISASSPDLQGVPKEFSPDILDVQKENQLDAKISQISQIVREEASMFLDGNDESPNIGQIMSIFEYYKYGNNTTKIWLNTNDPRGFNWAYANESNQMGKKTGNNSAGDYDDSAIVMSALVDSIGGTSRIVQGTNPEEAHAFAEVYLGRDTGQDSDVQGIIEYLKQNLSVDKIYTHVDTDTKDIWLNLDWLADHPGGPFYEADKYAIYGNRNQYDKTPLKYAPIYPIPQTGVKTTPIPQTGIQISPIPQTGIQISPIPRIGPLI